MKSPKQLFLHLNQYANPRHRMACTIYSSAINLYFNTGIKLEQYEIDQLVESAISKWILDIKKWWWLEDNFMHVFSYVKKKHPELQYDIFYKWNKKFVDYLNSSYMVRVWMSVNKQFTYDAQDNWIIDEIDYNKLKGKDLLHATSLFKWMKKWDDFEKKFIFDNYFWKLEYNQYEVKTWFSEIMMNNCYVFYVD